MELLMYVREKLRPWSEIKIQEDKYFLENGSIFLEKLIADCNGKSIPLRNFSSLEIRKATYNFDLSVCVKISWDHGRWYKGIIEDKPYLIKRVLDHAVGDVYNDIVLSARMSNHNNFLKLLGCCFEFSSPVVVFEYEELAFLSPEGHIVVNEEESILPWSVRLKIANEVAIAITYLHTAFPRIIIHKAITPSNIFLDKNWNAKLTNFRYSISLPEGISKIKYNKTSQAIWHPDPIFLATHYLSEYTDVYSFGVCLFVFLTRESANNCHTKLRPGGDLRGIINNAKGLYENGKLDEVIDTMMEKDVTSNQKMQMEAFVLLAFRCCEESEEGRPKMIQVAKELKRIQTSS